jgi:hypothetical protein
MEPLIDQEAKAQSDPPAEDPSYPAKVAEVLLDALTGPDPHARLGAEAVLAALLARPGAEPFNPDPEDIEQAWGEV